MQWDQQDNTIKTEVRRLFAYILNNQEAMISEIRDRTGMPGCIRMWPLTPGTKIDWLMEAGFVHDEGLNFSDDESDEFEFLVDWFDKCVPPVRHVFMKALRLYRVE